MVCRRSPCPATRMSVTVHTLFLSLLLIHSLVFGLSLSRNALSSQSRSDFRNDEKDAPTDRDASLTPFDYWSRRDVCKNGLFGGSGLLASIASMGTAATASDNVDQVIPRAGGAPTESRSTPSDNTRLPTPYLMPEYFDNPPETAPAYGRFFFPTITPPFINRATYRYTLGRNMWALEQLLAFANVTATIRTTVVRLKDGTLWVHSPQYPTGEFCKLLDDLGSVKHVVLPCNALEHKAPMQAFVNKYKSTIESVWIAPGQYGPFGSSGESIKEGNVGMGYRVDGILGDSTEASRGEANQQPQPPWADEFDFQTLLVSLPQNAGPVSEVVFCHKPTTTLIVTDALVYIPDRPAEIFRTYFDSSKIYDDQFFWPKTVLQSVFLPLRVVENVYPGYNAIVNRLVRAPILRAFNDARAPEATRTWIGKLSANKFDRIVTSHFVSPIAATPRDVQDAFGYLQRPKDKVNRAGEENSRLPPIACEDWELLDGLNQVIANNKLGAPTVFDVRQDCVP